MFIKGIQGVSELASTLSTDGVAKVAQSSPAQDFSQFFSDMVGTVNDRQLQADKAIQGLATGETRGLHEVMIAVEKSSISFQFLSQVRNKMIEAYQEVMRMQV